MDSHEPQLENLAREVQDSDLDTMRRVAKELLERDGYSVRTINFSPTGFMLAYVYKVNTQSKVATPIDGWVFKRSNLKSTT